MPNSTARRNARATKPRHKQARTTDHRTTDTRHDPAGKPRRDDNTWQANGDRRQSGNRRHDEHSGRRPFRVDERSHPDRGGRDDRAPHGRTDRRDAGARRDSWSNDRGQTRDNRGTNRRNTWPDDRRSDTGNRRSTGHQDSWSPNRRQDPWSKTRDRRDTTDWSTDRRSASRDRRSGPNDRAYRPTDSPNSTPNRDSDRRGRPDNAAYRHSAQEDRGRRSTRPAGRRFVEAPSERPAADRGQTATHWDGEIAEDRRTRGSVSFAELGLPTPLLQALEAAGITEPFPIQSATLPDALAGRDVLGRAQTGSGKTLAFGLALLTRLQKGKVRPGRPRGLVLVPTRELAMQVTEALMPLAKSLGLWCRTVVGGLSFTKQADQLQRGIDLLIATPGRLSDHVRQGTCVLDDVQFVTLDEADQMADMGFLPQVRAILDLVPAGQRMLFSATLDRDVAALVDRYLTDPVTHSISPPTATVSTMDHHLLLVSRDDKPAVVTEVAARDGRTILFLRTKHHVDRLTRQLRSVGVRAGALHGGKPQGARNRVLGDFKDGRLPVLVATDVAARGIHVDGVSLVVHVDPPADAKGYLHRAGRTARAGEAGTVVTLVTHQERRTVFRMTEQAGVEPSRTTVRPGDDDLARITGARTPSGEPVVEEEPTRRPPRVGGGRFNRPGARRRPR